MKIDSSSRWAPEEIKIDIEDMGTKLEESPTLSPIVALEKPPTTECAYRHELALRNLA